MIVDYSEKIYLKPITSADTENIIRWRNKDNVRKFFLDQRLFTVEGHTNWLENVVKTGRAAQFIIYEKDENVPVGSVFLRDIDYQNKKIQWEKICLLENEERKKLVNIL